MSFIFPKKLPVTASSRKHYYFHTRVVSFIALTCGNCTNYCLQYTLFCATCSSKTKLKVVMWVLRRPKIQVLQATGKYELDIKLFYNEPKSIHPAFLLQTAIGLRAATVPGHVVANQN